jgi:hypothetical protein
MKKTFKYLSSISLTILVCACVWNKGKNNSIIQVNVETGLNNMEVVNLSEFTDNIVYVPLQTVSDIPFGYIHSIDFSENFILVSDMSSCLLYDSSGHYITKIGSKGRGPGEYPYITNISFDSKNKIWLSDTENLYEYNDDGSFIKKNVNGVLVNATYYLPNWIPVYDSLFLGNVPNYSGKSEYKALITNGRGSVNYSYKNYIIFNRKKEMTGLDDHANIYPFKKEIFFKELNNDTLFHLSERLTLIPSVVFNLGKLKEPMAERENFKFDDHMLKYIYVENTYQTEDFLFLDCQLGNHFPAKRLTPKKFAVPTLKPVLFNTQNALGIYNWKKRSLMFCAPTSTDNPLFTSGLYNDIDGGPRFFPSRQVNDSTLAMWVTAKDLKDHVASNEFKNSTPKYNNKKKQLQDLAGRLTENDNSVLMFVTFKTIK